MEAEVKKSYPDANVELTRGSGGIFDVVCDGRLIYSKLSSEGQRFPKAGEVSKLISSLSGKFRENR